MNKLLNRIKYQRIYNNFNKLISDACRRNTIIYGSRVDIEVNGLLYVLSRYDYNIKKLVLYHDLIIQKHKDFGFGLSNNDICKIIKHHTCVYFNMDINKVDIVF